ncbi:hypothetical protein BDR26DRAFT_868157 [Obelidium mucronatum]|nr:hypothetical protein BDR26DRAFT_868157 [Obelidium mucronatum]
MESTKINWSCQNLSGCLSPTLSRFTSLVSLDLTENDLYGSITLRLSNTAISGVIPESLFTLPHLQTLSLCLTNITGPLPSSCFHSPSSSQLEYLYICSNRFLVSEIPHDWGNAFPKLKELYLSGNRLTGVLPQSFDELSNLSVLKVAKNWKLDVSTLPEILRVRVAAGLLSYDCRV